jgi:hypothetical protein
MKQINENILNHFGNKQVLLAYKPIVVTKKEKQQMQDYKSQVLNAIQNDNIVCNNIQIKKLVEETLKFHSDKMLLSKYYDLFEKQYRLKVYSVTGKIDAIYNKLGIKAVKKNANNALGFKIVFKKI